MVKLSHDVQFYDTEQFLSETVADFLAGGLEQDQPVVVIAAPTHRESFADGLKRRGLDLEAATRSGRLKMLDARETLGTFMRNGAPDKDAFVQSVGSVIGNSLAQTTHRSIRAYGEMVDILWKDGNREAAIRLEELWNDLAGTHSFSLLCAYDMGSFHSESHAEDFRRICSHHAKVVPTERYTSADEVSRMLEISILQQRAQALEAEIAHRVELERKLRESIVERDRLLEREHSARADAEAANRAKSDFLAVMSHELRTPLNAIGGHVQLVQMGIHGPVSEAQRDALQRVERSQRHLLSLINDVLNLVRVERGKAEYQIESVSVADVLKDVASLVDPLVSANGLKCDVACGADDQDIVVRADRDKVQQILLNLLTNAIKFTAPGGRITIEAEANCANVWIRVRDTGVGIPAAKLEYIFEPFVQLAARPHSGEEGLGLGLAISRDLARGMNGDLDAVSDVGRGTTFTVSLPLA
ncbi:MAG: ATP-binding protein [Gemmatimonadales bacterium]